LRSPWFPFLAESKNCFDLGIGQEVFYATIYSRCFHTLYFTEAGRRRKARENIGDFAGFLSDSKQNKHFVKNSVSEINS